MIQIDINKDPQINKALIIVLVLLAFIFLGSLLGNKFSGTAVMNYNLFSTARSAEPIIFVLDDRLHNTFNGDFRAFYDIVGDLNRILAKTTLKRYYLQRVIKRSEIDLGDISVCYSFKNRPFVTYILSEYSNDFLSQSTGMGSCFSKGSIVAPARTNTYYKRSDTAHRQEYIYQIYYLSHELSHTFGAGTPEYYDQVRLRDITGVVPYLDEKSLFDASHYPEYYYDPLFGAGFLNDPAGLEKARYGPLTAYFINRDINHAYDNPIKEMLDYSTKVRVTNKIGIPIAGATVKIYTIKGAFNQNSPPFNPSEPDQVLITDQNGETNFIFKKDLRLEAQGRNMPIYGRAIKVYKDGYQSNGILLSEFEIQLEKFLNNRQIFVSVIRLRNQRSTN